jgi:hypothetical protein
VGGQTVINHEEESKLVEGLLKCAEWGFPIRVRDIQVLVQTYLNNENKTVNCFRNNCPGLDRVQGFIGRNTILTSEEDQESEQS